MKLNPILAATALWAFAATSGWAIEIRDGSIEFTYDRIFYNNLPETLEAALLHPGVRSASKRMMLLRMAKDANLPGTLYQVLFVPAIHRERETTLSVMYALQNYHPEHLGRLGQFPFAIEAAVDMLAMPIEDRFEVQERQGYTAQVEIQNAFLDQTLAWFEALPETEKVRLAGLKNMEFFLTKEDGLAGSIDAYQFGGRYEKDNKRATYENILLHLRFARLIVKFGLVNKAKELKRHIALSLPSASYRERPDFEQELADVRNQTDELSQLLLATPPRVEVVVQRSPTAPVAPVVKPGPVITAAPVVASAAVEVAAPTETTEPAPAVLWTSVDERPAEKPILDAAAARDGYAMSIAIAKWPEGVRLSKKALVKLSEFMADPTLEISTALRQEIDRLLLPQLQVRMSELAYEVQLSPRNQALLNACHTHLLPRVP